MQNAVMKEKIKQELIKRFTASKAKSKAIVITMKVDNTPLIIEPRWCTTSNPSIERADLFSVYVDLPQGRATLPYLTATSIAEMAENIMGYSGIDFSDIDEQFVYYMKHAADFVAEYDMYEQEENAAYEYFGQELYVEEYVDASPVDAAPPQEDLSSLGDVSEAWDWDEGPSLEVDEPFNY